jgi:formamidopyrimidine-DNA glycosylase
MPELPEIYTIAKQMNEKLAGKTLTSVDVRQEKCLNMPVGDFMEMITGKTIFSVSAKGKWIFTRFQENVFLMISLGMGGDIIYHTRGDAIADNYRFLFSFDDGSFFHVNFNWFGYVHAATTDTLPLHGMTSDLGADPLDENFTRDKLGMMLKGKKGGIKSFLMNQRYIAGIGNVYVQDILFKAGLHPNRKIETLTELDKDLLHQAITGHLKYAADLGGLKWERDFFGNPGRYAYEIVGHRPGALCPVCSTPVKEIRTGGTRSYVCEKCQK